MLSSVLNSPTAISVNIKIIRIFTKLREILNTNKDILLKLEQLEKRIIKQDERLESHQEEINTLFKVLKQMIEQPKVPRKLIGFNREDEE